MRDHPQQLACHLTAGKVWRSAGWVLHPRPVRHHHVRRHQPFDVQKRADVASGPLPVRLPCHSMPVPSHLGWDLVETRTRTRPGYRAGFEMQKVGTMGFKAAQNSLPGEVATGPNTLLLRVAQRRTFALMLQWIGAVCMLSNARLYTSLKCSLSAVAGFVKTSPSFCAGTRWT